MDYSVFPYILAMLLLLCLIVFAIKGLRDGKIGGVVSVIVAIILMVVVGLPAMGFGSEESEPLTITTMAYDDYIEVGDQIESASGSLELVTLVGKTYLHANDVGEGNYTQDGVTKTIAVGKADLLVYMIAGQSNSSHEVYSRPMVDPVIAPGVAYYFGSSHQVMRWSSTYSVTGMSMHDMWGNGTEPIAANIDEPFAYMMNQLSGKKVFMVNTGIGGTAISSWTPGGSSWTYSKTLFNAAMQSIDTDHYNVTVKDFIWIQGEADSGTAVGTYKTRFLSMFDSFTNSESSNPFGYVFGNALISKVREYNGVNSSIAQIQLCNENSHIYMASMLSDTFTMENGLMLGDNVHYSQLGDNLLGAEIARFAFTV